MDENVPSELAELEARIAEAQRRLSLTLDAAGATGAWDWDIPNRILRGDASFAMLAGHDAVALATGIGTRNFFEGIHEDDRTRIRLSVAAMLSGAEIFDKDFRIRKSDGGLRWVHGKGRTILDEQDSPIRFVGDLVDVTEKKRTQEQLRIAQTAGGIGTFEHADGFGTVEVSPQFCHLLGLHPTRVLPVSTIDGLIHPDDPPLVEVTRRGDETSGDQVEFRITRADTGEARWLARRGEYVRDLSGPGLRYIGVAYDITDSKLVEEQLRRANRKLSESVRTSTEDLKRIWQNSRDLLAVLDLDGRIRSANPAWNDVLGYHEPQLKGRRLADFLWSDEGQQPSPEGAVGVGHFEAKFRHVDGSLRCISWTTTLEGSSTYAYGRDITVQREQEIALREAEARLRQSQKMEAVGQLTGGIAHDFNNMLTSIIGGMNIIGRRIKTGRYEDLDRFIDAATVSAHRAAALTHRLLAFSRRQTLDRRAVDIAKLARGMSDLLNRTLGEHVTLTLDLDDAWPVVTDANQLENALLNLAINARDAMPDGGELRISAGNVTLRPGLVPAVGLDDARDFVVIKVQDTGVGMPKDVLEKVFDPFFTTKPLGQGTGLGLSMVYGFAQQSGGGADIESVEGRGTTISIYLPRSQVAEEIAEDGEPGTVPSGAGERVLVVEDDDGVRQLVGEVLRDLGYKSVEAIDANAAIEKLRVNPSFDLLISDVGLPGMNGRQLAEIARGIIPNIKVLFMTGYAASAADQADFLGRDMTIITKPFDIEKLGLTIRRILD